MVGGFKRQRHTAFVAYGKRFQRGYGMLLDGVKVTRVVPAL